MKTNMNDIDTYLVDYLKLRPKIENNKIIIAEVALFLEDTFDITLSDREICQENLGTHESLRNLIIKKLERKNACAESAG